jgi:hypothetical protein
MHAAQMAIDAVASDVGNSPEVIEYLDELGNNDY